MPMVAGRVHRLVERVQVADGADRVDLTVGDD
jgi:hypothetical protein